MDLVSARSYSRNRMRIEAKYLFVILIVGIIAYWNAYITHKSIRSFQRNEREFELTEEEQQSTVAVDLDPDTISLEEQFISPIISGFHPEWHPISRSERFPSVEDRVKLYMSNYYLPPCAVVGYESKNTNTTVLVDDRFRFHFDFSNMSPHAQEEKLKYYPKVHLTSMSGRSISTLPTTARPDTPFVLWEEALDPQKSFNAGYFVDALKILQLAKEITGKTRLEDIAPIVAQFGDHENYISKHVPSLHKFRQSTRKEDLELVTNPNTGIDCTRKGGRKPLVVINRQTEESLSPIIWLLNYSRHFELVSQIPSMDIPWESKIDKAIWRGVPTGGGASANRNQSKPFDQRCELVPRCRFVRDNLLTPGLDVGFSHDIPGAFRIDPGHSDMVKGTKDLKSLLQYKVIIIMEGNDISSGLKWALYSRSVVMMPTPTKTSFAMEELLEPWTHYVPLKDDMSDVSDKMKWVLENDQKARRISERATLFMHDMLFHKDAEEENRQIQEEILKRYLSFFVSKA